MLIYSEGGHTGINSAVYRYKLCEEIDETAKIADEFGLKLETIYFGGGTPTVLESNELARLMDRIERAFDLTIYVNILLRQGV